MPYGGEITDLKGYVQPFGDSFRFGERLRLVGAAERHRDTDDLVTLLLEKQGRHGRIDAARDADRDFHRVFENIQSRLTSLA